MNFLHAADQLTAYFTSGPGAGSPDAPACRAVATEWASLLRAPQLDQDAAMALAEKVTTMAATGSGAEELRTLIPMWAKSG